MKKNISIFLIFLYILIGAQKKYILRDLQNGKEFVKKDSASAAKFLDSLAENNFYFTKVKNIAATEKAIKIDFDKGQNYNEAEVSVADSLAHVLKIKNRFFTKNLDSARKSISAQYAGTGYTFSRIRTRFTGLKNGVPQVLLSAYAGKKRVVTGIVFKGYSKLPSRFIKNIHKEIVGKSYAPAEMEKLRKSLESNRYISQEKPPQTLFTKDSTNIYLFFNKRKASTFDGIIGFGNDKSQKITFNGSLDVNFRNIFNKFEDISIFWQRNPDKGQTFNLQTDIPYLAGTDIGLTLGANIYRQDSAYATVKISPAIYYHISAMQKVGIKPDFETSSVAQVTADTRNFNKKGIGLWYELYEPAENPLLQFRTRINADIFNLHAEYPDQNEKDSQFSYLASAERNFNVKGNHFLNFKVEAARQGGKFLATNELLRFGGWNSMRGFAENSLLADSYYYTNLEYRYLLGTQAFFDVFGQYGKFTNNALSLQPTIYSVGFGFHFFLPIGLMSFQISNGAQAGNPFRFADTKIHWGVLSRF